MTGLGKSVEAKVGSKNGDWFGNMWRCAVGWEWDDIIK